jgi:hypothetical protein
MTKPQNIARTSGAKREPAGKARVGGGVMRTVAGAEPSTAAPGPQVAAVMAAAQRSGLLEAKSGRIGGRISPALVKRAKARTGIEADTDLIEFALANIALEDKFAESFKAIRGAVDPDLKLGF